MSNNNENQGCGRDAAPRAVPPEKIRHVLDQLCPTYQDNKAININKENHLPTRAEVQNLVNDLIEVMMPGFHKPLFHGEASLCDALIPILYRIDGVLFAMVTQSLKHLCNLSKPECGNCCVETRADQIVSEFLNELPRLRTILKLDITAAYDGDPAAISHDEVIVSYPGLYTLTVQRLAHLLYKRRVPLIPRMMTELAHSSTGIDIHPGAQIGAGVFIDHGTGVVVGETTIIGEGVKIYQGVTLGALSFPKDACGKLVRGTKRHPTIGRNVTLYAGATILGNITIGDNSVIGGNVWVTESLPPDTKVTSAPPAHNISQLH